MEISNYHIAIGNATDVGKVRDHNEDYMAHFDTPLGYCIIVCDGMGGHAAGDVASQNAIEAIKHFLQNGKITILDVPSSLQNAIEFANFKLREMVQQNSALKGMGTTCVIALINHAELYVAHAGDSRLYLIRDKEIKQISKDHSTVQNLIDVGALTEKEAEQSDKKNQITKAIGIFEKVEPTVTKTAIQLLHNDKILLCSDGLTAHVNKEKIVETVLSVNDIQNAVLKLISQANEGGGSDNITVQIVQYVGESIAKKRKVPIKIIRIAIILIIALVCFGAWMLKSSSNKKVIVNPDSTNVISPKQNANNEDKDKKTADKPKHSMSPKTPNENSLNRKPKTKDSPVIKDSIK